MQVCCRCSSKLVGTFFELIHDARSKDNNHFVCAGCFCFLHANRGCQPWFECPDCSLPVNGHYVWKKTVLSSTRRKATLSQAEERQLPAVFTNGATSIQLDPCRYFKAQEEAFKLDNVMVSMQWFDSGCTRDNHFCWRSFIEQPPGFSCLALLTHIGPWQLLTTMAIVARNQSSNLSLSRLTQLAPFSVCFLLLLSLGGNITFKNRK